MKHTDRELHERLQHTEWLRRWDSAIVADDPRWLKIAMTCLLAGAAVTAAVYVAAAVLR